MQGPPPGALAASRCPSQLSSAQPVYVYEFHPRAVHNLHIIALRPQGVSGHGASLSVRSLARMMHVRAELSVIS